VSARRAGLGLAALVAVSTLLRWLAARHVEGPWISPDETVYALLGQGLYRHGSLAILGGPTPFYSLVFPALVGPFLSLHDLAHGYALLKPVLALAMSLAAVPVFFWARPLVGRGWALAAAALTLALPGLAYSGLVMTEVAFYPVLTLAAWTTARAVAEPTPRRIAWLAGAFALALLTRLQALVLLPVLVGALGLDAAFARSWSRLARSARTLAGVAVPVVAWVVVQQVRGEPLLGAYASVAGSSYHAHDAFRFVVWHAGALVLTTGVLPACALLALAARAGLRGEPDPFRRATIATVLALACVAVLQVGVFASRHVGQIAERDLLCVAPSLLVCFVLWIRSPVSLRERAGAGALAFVLVAVLPLAGLVTQQALPDAITFAPLWRLAVATSGTTMRVSVLVVAAAGVALFVLLPRRTWLVAVLLVAFVAGSVASSRELVTQARATRAALVGPKPRWVDAVAGDRRATYVYDGNHDWPSVWQALFWNRSVDRVATINGAVLPGPAPQTALRPSADGRLDVHTPLLVIPASYSVAGTALADAVQTIPGQAGLRVWQLTPPPRLASLTVGVQANGDIYGNTTGTLYAYGCTKGTWALTLIPKGATDIDIRQDGKLLQHLHFAPGEPKAGYVNLDLPVRAHTGTTCRLDVRGNNVVGTTRFAYRPG
jgi:hypothetical protein